MTFLGNIRTVENGLMISDLSLAISNNNTVILLTVILTEKHNKNTSFVNIFKNGYIAF